MKKFLCSYLIILGLLASVFGYEYSDYLKGQYVIEYMEYKTTDNLRLRKNQKISSEVITTINKGSAVFILKEGESEKIDNIESNWVKVSVQNDTIDNNGYPVFKGTEGWFFGGYLTPSSNSKTVFDTWISWGASEKSASELSVQFHLTCSAISKEKNLVELKNFISYCKDADYFPFNPLISIIEEDWKEGFDYIMSTNYFSVLADKGYLSGKYGENLITPFNTILKKDGPNNLYYAEKLIPYIDINRNREFCLNYNIDQDNKIQKLIIERERLLNLVKENKIQLTDKDLINIPGINIKMLRTEVTQELYESVMGENPSEFIGKEFPVERVSWYDAIYFCNLLSYAYGLEPVYSINDISMPVNWNYTPHKGHNAEFSVDGHVRTKPDANGFRLPKVSEWQYAAKGGQDYKYAGSNNLDEVAWYSDNSDNKSHPVAQKKPNGYGLYDMSGNVCEWCRDRKESYRYICGGSSIDVISCEVSRNSIEDVRTQYRRIGFRIVCSAF